MQLDVSGGCLYHTVLCTRGGARWHWTLRLQHTIHTRHTDTQYTFITHPALALLLVLNLLNLKPVSYR